MSARLSVHHVHAWLPWRWDKGVRSPGTGVIDGFKQPGQCWEPIGVLCKSSQWSWPLSHLSSAQTYFFLWFSGQNNRMSIHLAFLLTWVKVMERGFKVWNRMLTGCSQGLYYFTEVTWASFIWVSSEDLRTNSPWILRRYHLYTSTLILKPVHIFYIHVHKYEYYRHTFMIMCKFIKDKYKYSIALF